jgi:cytochrome c
MFNLDNITKLKTILAGVAVASLVATSASAATYTVQSGDTIAKIAQKLGLKSVEAGNFQVPSGDLSKIQVGQKITYTPSYKMAVDGAVTYPTVDGKYGPYHVNTQDTTAYNSGRDATEREIRAWDVDVMYDGTGAPMYDMKHGEIVKDENGNPKKAEGSVELGAQLFEEQCVMCHGEFGAGGVGGYPRLSGGNINSLKIQRLDPKSKNPNPDNPIKTIGTYWPYASTLFWYIQDAMPFPHPKSLSNSETYALTAYLLMENGIEIDGEELDDEYVLDREKFLKIKMPNRDGFYPEVNTKNPQDGIENMRAFLGNPSNYGTGTRCMTDCYKEDMKDLLMEIKIDLAPTAGQPLSTKRTLPPKDEAAGPAHPGQALYDANGCAGCHANAAIGAPVTGDKDAWAAVLEKGIDKVYANGINGINAMPPKGGTGVSDDEFKLMVDYMIDASK